MKKLLIFFVFCSAILIMSCTQNNSPKQTSEELNAPPGKQVYTKSCRLCHGTDGGLGLSGAANLKMTALTVDEIKVVVENGRKGMPAWKAQLSAEQIQQVSEYVVTLKK